MKKSKKIVIGVLVLVLLLGLYYLYLIYNTEPLTSYDQYCQQVQGNDFNADLCAKQFKQKCQSTGGIIKKETQCGSPPCPEGVMCAAEIKCWDINVYCKCFFLRGWRSEKGCKFF